MYSNVKRIMDVLISSIGLIILFPVFVLIAICIKIDSPGPIFFRQKRVGLLNKTFYIYKFRTMKVSSPNNMPTAMLSNPHQFITRIGKLIRKSSLDELPQLINIIRGDMSIVGPRPVVLNEKKLIDKRRKKNVYSVLPGLTGWAQINGRDELSNEEKVYYDSEYVKRRGFLMDFKIIIYTVAYVLKMEGIVEGFNIATNNIRI